MLLKAIELTDGERSPKKKTHLPPINIYTESSETLMLDEESITTPNNKSEIRGSILGNVDSSGFIDLPE